MSRFRAAWLIAVGFAAGALVGAGTLWIVQNDLGQTPVAAEATNSTASTERSEQTTPESPSLDPDVITVEYEVRTDGMSVTHLSYVDITDGNPEMVELLGTPPPFSHVIQIPRDADFDLADLSVTGMGAATSSMTTCTLTINGKRVARQNADGTYGLVNCAAPEGFVVDDLRPGLPGKEETGAASGI